MNETFKAEASTANELDATDGDIGIFKIDRLADEDALNDEAYERYLAFDANACAFRDIDRLRADVRRGVKSVRGAVIDDDSLSGLAQEAYTRTGNHVRQAFVLGRDWALENPNLTALARQDRLYERRDRREARRVKERGELAEF